MCVGLSPRCSAEATSTTQVKKLNSCCVGVSRNEPDIFLSGFERTSKGILLSWAARSAPSPPSTCFHAIKNKVWARACPCWCNVYAPDHNIELAARPNHTSQPYTHSLSLLLTTTSFPHGRDHPTVDPECELIHKLYNSCLTLRAARWFGR